MRSDWTVAPAALDAATLADELGALTIEALHRGAADRNVHEAAIDALADMGVVSCSGGGPTVTLHVPNWPSDVHANTVLFSDFTGGTG